MIVSADSCNRSELHTVAVPILTTHMQLAALPGNVAVPAEPAAEGARGGVLPRHPEAKLIFAWKDP